MLASDSANEPLLADPGSYRLKGALPGIAGVVVYGMELFQLLPCEVGDAQWIATRDHRVRVLRKQSVLEML